MRREARQLEEPACLAASSAKPAVSVTANASTMPTTSRAPNARTIGTGDSSRTRNPAAVAAPAVAITGPPASAPPPRAPSARNRDWNWIA